MATVARKNCLLDDRNLESGNERKRERKRRKERALTEEKIIVTDPKILY